MPKSIDYWERELEEARYALFCMENAPTSQLMYAMAVDYAPQRRDSRRRWVWRRAFLKWRLRQQRIMWERRKHEKLLRRIAYIEERIRLTTPCFWERL